ncbi:MAG TPA: hypothetical protein VFA20_20595 [Myxococcaceae bacterium]|nr:hypothetical protein [Myxococcaceae bacterium]
MSADLSALCAAHSAPAMGPCDRCGTFVCDQCGYRKDEHIRCHSCPAPAAEKPPGVTLTALLLSAVGFVCPPLSLVGLFMALVWRLSADKRTAMGAQYARWAVVVGLLSLVGGGATYWWMGKLIVAAQQSAASINAGGPGSPKTPRPGP